MLLGINVSGEYDQKRGLSTKALSDGKEVLNFKLKKGESTTFRYRMVIASEHLKDATLNELAAA